MLSSRLARPLCRDCKLDLYQIFVYGLASRPELVRSHVSRLSNLRNQSRAFRAGISRRSEASTTIQDEPIDRAPPIPPRDDEAAARSARDVYGHTLPANLLNKDEYRVYERLYGAPLRETTSDDDELRLKNDYEDVEVEDYAEASKPKVYKQNKDGRLRAVEEEIEEEENEDEGFEDEHDEDYDEDGEGTKPVSKEVQASRAARAQLRLDMIAAERRHYIETGEVDEESEELGGPRTHPYTTTGRFATDPYSVTLPNRTFVTPITELLRLGSFKQLREMAHKTFGGANLVDSIATPTKAQAEHFQQKPIALEASQTNMGEMEASAYVAVNLPGAYASVMGILVECRKRLGSDWLEGLLAKEGGPKILDAGAAGAGVLAWKDILRAEWQRLHPDVKQGDPVPFGKATVITGSSELRSRVNVLLDNTTFIPRMPDFVPTRDLPGAANHNPALRKQYDVVIAAHSLWTLKEDYMRKAQVQNYFTLLNPNGGVLILLEKGVPRGFELVAGAREVLLKHHIASPGEVEKSIELTGFRTHKEPGMIIAPCTNHGQCPMYPESGAMVQRKDWCHFSQRFVRPAFLQDILGKSHHNHEDISFSYVAVRRGIDSRPAEQKPRDEEATLTALKGFEKSEAAPNSLSLPRLLLPPLKRHKHVVMDVCTPAGKIERWTTSQSFSRQSYRDGRKARWGDLWALGAKVRVVRQARTGRPKKPGKGKVPRDVQGENFQHIDRSVTPDANKDRTSKPKSDGPRKRRTKQDMLDV